MIRAFGLDSEMLVYKVQSCALTLSFVSLCFCFLHLDFCLCIYPVRQKTSHIFAFPSNICSVLLIYGRGFPGDSVVKNPSTNASSIPGSERSPGEGNGNRLQCSCLENPMDRGAWQAMVHGVTKELDST